jgi:hypothetical protein
MRRNGHMELGWEVSIRTKTDGQRLQAPHFILPSVSIYPPETWRYPPQNV